VRSFMRSYLQIGEDPRDTLVRDRVWAFLLTKTKHAMSERELDAIWDDEVGKSERVCVVQ